MWAIEDSPGPKAAYRGGGIILPLAILLSGTERRSYPLSFHLQLRDSRSPIRSRSNDLRLGSRFAHAHAFDFLTPTRGSTPLTGTFGPLRSAAEPDLSGGAGACRSLLSLLANKGPTAPTKQLIFFIFRWHIHDDLYLINYLCR